MTAKKKKPEPGGRKSTAPRLTVEAAAKMIAQASGNLTVAASLLNVRRQSLHRFINLNPGMKDAVAEARASFIDNVESAHYKAALDGNVTAQIFILKCLARDRGYIERQDVAATATNLNIDYDDLTDGELARLAAGEHPATVLADRRRKAS